MPTHDELAFASLKTLGQKLRRGECTAVELTELFLDRLDRLGGTYNAVVTLVEKPALKEARRADAELQAGQDRGPLHGIPYGAKDLLATQDAPTTWGSAPLKDQQIDDDATVISRLREAGAVLTAKLSMVEIAGGMGYRQANASFTGPGINPWNESRWSGGSSSGPGSAVAAGLVPFAIGSETWGSIVTPATFCGITGLRPTYGRVSRHGAMALSWTMDKLGPMAHSAEDCGMVLEAIAGPDANDSTAANRPFQFPPDEPLLPPFRLAILKGAAEGVQPEIASNYERSLEVLRKFATLEETELPDLPFGDVAATLISCEMAAAFEGMVTSGDVWELTAPEDRWGAYPALMIPAKDYINAMRIRVPIQQQMDELLSRFDAIVAPSSATVAYPLDEPWSSYREGFYDSDIDAAGNAAGLPAVCVSNGFGEADLPTGIQFVGRAFEENRLLRLAEEYQNHTDWHEKHPEV